MNRALLSSLIAASCLLGSGELLADEASASLSFDSSSGAEGSASASGDSDGDSGRISGELGLRTGFSLPAGDVGNGVGLRDISSWEAPVWADLGARFGEPLFLGLYGATGIGSAASGCEDDAKAATGGTAEEIACSYNDLHFGVQGQLHLGGRGDFDPWLGAGIGWEWLTNRAKFSTGGAAAGFSQPSITQRYQGPELLLQGGLDLHAFEDVFLGPFLSAQFGRFSSLESECSEGLQCTGNSIDESGVHSWITLGIRASVHP